MTATVFWDLVQCKHFQSQSPPPPMFLTVYSSVKVKVHDYTEALQ